MKVLVVGGHYAQNVGDEASLIGLHKLLHLAGHSPEILILTRPSAQRLTSIPHAQYVENFEYVSAQDANGRGFRGLDSPNEVHALEETIEAIREADVLAFGNGVLFRDIVLGTFRGPLSMYVALAGLAIAALKPVVAFSVTLVEPRTQAGRHLFRILLSTMSTMSVRDDESKHIAVKYGMSPKHVIVCPDFAYAIERRDLGIDNCADERDITLFNFRDPKTHGLEPAMSNEVATSNAANLLRRFSHMNRGLVASAAYDIEPVANDNVFHDRVHSVEPSTPVIRLSPHSLRTFVNAIDGTRALVTERRHGFIVAASTRACPAILLGTAPNNARGLRDYRNLLSPATTQSLTPSVVDANIEQTAAVFGQAMTLRDQLIAATGSIFSRWTDRTEWI